MKQEILDFIIDNTVPEDVTKAYANHNLHSLYRNKWKNILYKYFDGHTLHYSVFMCSLFNEFITEGESMKMQELDRNIKELKRIIRISKKYRENCTKQVAAHNNMVSEYNTLAKKANKFYSLYKKRRKQMPL